DILFEGRSIVGMSPDAILRLGISLVPEGRRIFGRLTVGENLKIGTTARRDRRRADEDIKRLLERFPVLQRDWSKSGAKLSGGEQQQLAIARALLAKPKLLLLDEPTLGLAPLMVDRVFEILEELKREGSTILLVEQNAARTIEVADRTYVMRSGGRIEFHGTAAERRRDRLHRNGGVSRDAPGVGVQRHPVHHRLDLLRQLLRADLAVAVAALRR